MLDELDRLINFIKIEHLQLTNKWEGSESYTKINLKVFFRFHDFSYNFLF